MCVYVAREGSHDSTGLFWKAVIVLRLFALATGLARKHRRGVAWHGMAWPRTVWSECHLGRAARSLRPSRHVTVARKARTRP